MLRNFLIATLFLQSTIYADQLPKKTISKNTKPKASLESPSALPDLLTIQKNLSQFSFLSTDFSLISYKKMRNITSEKTGTADFAKPNQFRIVFQKPEKKSLIFDGEYLYEVKDDKKEGFRFSAKKSKELSQIKEIAEMMVNFHKLSERFQVGKPQEIPGTSPADRRISIELTPLNDPEMIQVKLRINLKLNLVEKVRLEFKGGNYTEYNFANPKRNPLDSSTFQPPLGYKIAEGLQ